MRLHAWAIDRYGGTPGIQNRNAFESCLARPRNHFFDYEPYPGLAEKAAAYSFFIARNHPFVDGNKRAALLVGIHFLRKNGIAHVYDEDAIADAIEAVVIGEAGINTLIALFRGS